MSKLPAVLLPLTASLMLFCACGSTYSSAPGGQGGQQAAGGQGGQQAAGGQGGQQAAGGQGGQDNSCMPNPGHVTGCPTDTCNHCDADGTCITKCDMAPGGGCKNNTITCPEGRPCRVDCTTFEACANTTVECPQDYPCTLACSAPRACSEAMLKCAAGGMCTIKCNTTVGPGSDPSGNACEGARVECSDKDCLAICKPDAKKPNLNCDSNSDCACESC